MKLSVYNKSKLAYIGDNKSRRTCLRNVKLSEQHFLVVQNQFLNKKVKFETVGAQYCRISTLGVVGLQLYSSKCHFRLSRPKELQQIHWWMQVGLKVHTEAHFPILFWFVQVLASQRLITLSCRQTTDLKFMTITFCHNQLVTCLTAALYSCWSLRAG